MGCCCSSENDKESLGGDADIRTPLINPVSNNTIPGQTSNVPYGTANSSDKRDELSALNRILHNTAANIIDVSAIDSHTVEQNEFVDREKNYSNHISSISGDVVTTLRGEASTSSRIILDDAGNVERVLSAQPISSDDINLITNASKLLEKSMESVKVEHKENLVVPFKVDHRENSALA